MVQLHNALQSSEHGLVALLDVSEKLEDQQSDGDGNRGPRQHQ
jgi:hypothetical protein